MNKKFLAGILVVSTMIVLSSRISLAQDPLVVAPDAYKLVFENERVRVMEVTFEPGAKIAEHSHPDHFAYILEPGTLRISHPDGTWVDLEAKAGDVVWINAETHWAENIGTTKIHILVTELKENAPVVVTTQ